MYVQCLSYGRMGEEDSVREHSRKQKQNKREGRCIDYGNRKLHRGLEYGEIVSWNKFSVDFILKAMRRLKEVKQGSDMVRSLFSTSGTFSSRPCFKENYTYF